MKKRILSILLCWGAFAAAFADGSFFIDFSDTPLSTSEVEADLCRWLGAAEESSFEKIAEYDDEIGMTHSVFRQSYMRTPIKDAVILLHSRNGDALSLNGNAMTAPPPALHNALTQNAAEVCPSSVIVPVESPDGTTYRRACVVFVPERMVDFYIDSENGDTLCVERRITGVSAEAYTLYSGWRNIDCSVRDGYRMLVDEQRGITTKDASDNTPINYNMTTDRPALYERFIDASAHYITDAPQWYAVDDNEQPAPHPALDVHWGTEMAYDFFLNTFGLKSFDGEGHPLINLISPPHDDRIFSSMPNNAAAYVSGEPYFMFYGMGDGRTILPFVSLDIIAHEYTHLVTHFNRKGGISTSGESGSLNESFSDIMAMGVEHYATGACDWLLGAEIFAMKTNLRDLSDPNNGMSGKDPQPDTYKGLFWENTTDLTEKGDYGGVHANDGVQNFWFYLLAEGGAGVNDNGDSYTVQGIGLDDALRIAYRNMMHYITPGSKYIDAFRGSALAAKDLFSVHSEQYRSVLDAWYAVGVCENLHPLDDNSDYAAVFVNKRTVYVRTANGRSIRIWDANGRLVDKCTTSGEYTEISVIVSGVYIVDVEGKKFKVIVF